MPNYFNLSLSKVPATYFLEHLQPIVAAITILFAGWIIAVIVASAIEKLLRKIKTNQKLHKAIGGESNIERIISRVIFWIVMVLVIIGVLNTLNLNSISQPLSNMIQKLLLFIPQLLAAIIVGFLSWIVANLIKVSVKRLLDRTKLDEKLNTATEVRPISQNIADILYWLTLLLFLPIILSILGLTGLLYPVQNMLNQAIGFIPNLFMASVVIFVGYLLAKILSGIVEGLGYGINLQKQFEKIGLFQKTNIIQLLKTLVFAIVIITALIIAFEVLGVQTISEPATAMLNKVMSAIPNIIGAGLIIILAYIISRFIAQLAVDLLSSSGIDLVPEKLGIQCFLGNTKVSSYAGYLIVLFTMLFAVSEAANRLEFNNISELISIFIQFGANILLGTVILAIGFWLANIVSTVIERGKYNSSRWLAKIVRVLIIGLVLAMGLRAMGIADSIVNLAFGLTLGSVAVAFAIAFGLGGRIPAERILNYLIDYTKNDPVKEKSPTADLKQENDKGESQL